MAGRKRKLTKKVIDKVLNSIRYGKTEQYSCQKAGISYETFRRWQHEDPKNIERLAQC
jgi:hypothetical protein